MHLGVAIIALILCVTLVHCEAQVTFSAGWNPGKRNANAGYVAAIGASPSIGGGRNIKPTIKSITTVCHLLLNQIHDLANCEATKYDPHGQDSDAGLFEQMNK